MIRDGLGRPVSDAEWLARVRRRAERSRVRMAARNEPTCAERKRWTAARARANGQADVS